jgi:hypothetical protein
MTKRRKRNVQKEAEPPKERAQPRRRLLPKRAPERARKRRMCR